MELSLFCTGDHGTSSFTHIVTIMHNHLKRSLPLLRANTDCHYYTAFLPLCEGQLHKIKLKSHFSFFLLHNHPYDAYAHQWLKILHGGSHNVYHHKVQLEIDNTGALWKLTVR